MKKSFTVLLFVIFSVNIALAQFQTTATRDYRSVKSSKSTLIKKSITEITGGMTCLSTYIPGATSILTFRINFTSSDEEFLDGLSMTFPAGMTPIVTGTSDPIATNTGCSSGSGQLNPISGQTITWGEITTQTQCGYLDTGTYVFSVAVTVGAISGVQTVAYTAYGDGYGVAPNTFTGNILVNPAPANDISVTAIIAPSAGMLPVAITPQVTVKNCGSATQTNIPVKYKIGIAGTVVSANITSLAPGASTNVSFPSWTPTVGTYIFFFYCDLAGDINHMNDTMKRTVNVSNLTWSAGANTTLSGYMGSAATCGGKLYAMGGNQIDSAGAGVAIYDVAGNSWTSGPSLPAARVVGMAAGTSTKVYFIGGSDGTTNQTTVWELTPPGTTWAVKAPLPVILSWAKTAVYQDSLIYVLGGFDGTNYVATVYLYNNVNNTWRTCTPMPAGVIGGVAGIAGNTLVFTAGANSTSTVTTTYEGVISAANHANIVWTTGTPIPSAAFKADGGTWGANEIIVATGTDGSVDWWTPTTPSQSYAYNPTTHAWRILANKTTPTVGGYTATLLFSSTSTSQTWKIVSASGYIGTAVTPNTELLTEVFEQCANPTNGGVIATDVSGCSPFDPSAFTSTSAPAGQSGTLEYKWQSSTTSSTAGFSDIPSSNATTYDPGSITLTTWYKRIAHVDCKTDWTGAAESNVVKVTVNNVSVGDTTATACNSFTWFGNTYTSSGTHTKILTNAGGCDSTVTLHLTISTVNTSVTLNGNTITVNNAANNYQWLDCNNAYAIINGATSQSYTATAVGSYAVKITHGLCTDTSACVQITTVGIASIQTGGLSIYPNPVSNELKIEMEGNTSNVSFEILNSLGQVVYRGILLDKTTVETSGFSSGIYLIKLENGKIFKFNRM